MFCRVEEAFAKAEVKVHVSEDYVASRKELLQGTTTTCVRRPP